MTEFYKICIVLEHCIPRLCNGSTSDSGSDCGGSNPPWGTKRGCPERIIAVVNIIWQLSSLRTASFFWPLRITASTADSHSVNRSSILLGAINNSLKQHWFWCCFFVLNETPGIELRKERLQKGEQCAAFLQFAAREGGKSESRRRRRKHDKNYILVIFIITVCSSVAFTNCNSCHPWLAANAEFIWEKTGGFRLSRFDSPRGYK